MKRPQRTNKPFSKGYELDDDALEAMHEFEAGVISLDELKELVGPEYARGIREQLEDDSSIESLFDNPEDF